MLRDESCQEYRRFPAWPSRVWVLGQMALARLAFRAMPEGGYYKLCGSGVGQGFALGPDLSVWAVLATWPNAATARACIDSAPVYRRWRDRAAES